MLFKACSTIVLFFIILGPVHATALTCTGGRPSVGGDYAVIKSGRMITTPNNSNGFSLLYTVSDAFIQPAGSIGNTTCTSTEKFNVGRTLLNTQAGTVYTYNGYTIYPTSVKGIGISVNVNSTYYKGSFALWPSVAVGTAVFGSGQKHASNNTDMYVDIRVWKTPEYTYQTGGLSFTGPTVMLVLQPNKTGDTIASCPTTESQYDDRTCILSSRVLTGTVDFVSGTCDLTNTAQTVNMGSFYGKGDNSAWKDASFALKCPTAYGYGGKVTGATNSNDPNNGTSVSNSSKNATVTIQVIPYTPVITASAGIFELDSGGAEGYGLQLAWGLPSAQGSKPTNPVIFGSSVTANSLNSNFKVGPYAYGGSAIDAGADASIAMSVRYIRTTGNIVGGVANGAVEILASYE